MSELDNLPSGEGKQEDEITPEERVVQKLKEEKKKNWWTRKTKGQQLSFILLICFVALVAIGIVIVFNARAVFGDELADKWFGEGVSNGFQFIGNWFSKKGESIAWSFITIGITIVLVFIINGIVSLCSTGTKKSRTIGSLLKSCIKYLSIIIDFAFILGIWGVNITAIVAGLGIVGMILGLGCQNLIKDIVAGLFIVFDDYYSVGETVILDDFRGVVVEIGLKTTKLDNGLGELRSYANSEIGKCINISRSLNTVSVTAGFGYNEDIRKVEALIYDNLPKIKERIPRIVEGPTYKGVTCINDSSVDLKVVCKCKYSDKFQVERDLQRELYLLYVDNGITIPYPQVTINPQDSQDQPRATKEEIEKADKLNFENRKPEEKKAKESFLKRAKDSFTIEITGDDD